MNTRPDREPRDRRCSAQALPLVALAFAPLAPARAEAQTSTTSAAPIVLSGYVEAMGTISVQAPSNGIIHLRGFDDRHATFAIANVALDLAWDHHGVIGKLALQVGTTPSTYYLAEPRLPGSPGASASSAELWKYVQQAYAGYRFPVLDGLSVTLGVFLSPIGPESIAIRDDWHWSRSNLFFGLPFYHTGLRAALALDARWTVTVGLLNGWNSVIDNNDEKSTYAQLTYAVPDSIAVGLLYFTGAERGRDAPEGRAWRHLFDGHATWTVTDHLALQLHADGGFEPHRLGTSAWIAGAAAARVLLLPGWWLAARGDLFGEITPDGASTIFWPAAWVASATATVEYRPADQVSLRLEYRHDHAADDVYFGGTVRGDGLLVPYVPNRSSQDTLTAGVAAWF